jgi:hypothetical protein
VVAAAVVEHEPAGHHTVISGHHWSSVVISGHQWSSVVEHENLQAIR